MNNRFKFRAKLIIDTPNQREGEWLYWDLLDGFGNLKDVIDPETVGQCTERNDRKGTEIYEGDLIKKDRGNGDEIFLVIWSNGSFHISKNGRIEDYLLGHCASGEIIGNKHDNKNSKSKLT